MSLEKTNGGTLVRTKTNGTGLFRGPFGVWVWPIVNLLMVVIDKMRNKSGGGAISAARTKITELRPTAEGGWSILEHEV